MSRKDVDAVMLPSSSTGSGIHQGDHAGPMSIETVTPEGHDASRRPVLGAQENQTQQQLLTRKMN